MGEVVCILCGDPVDPDESVPGPEWYPVHEECLYGHGRTPLGGRHI